MVVKSFACRVFTEKFSTEHRIRSVKHDRGAEKPPVEGTLYSRVAVKIIEEGKVGRVYRIESICRSGCK